MQSTIQDGQSESVGKRLKIYIRNLPFLLTASDIITVQSGLKYVNFSLIQMYFNSWIKMHKAGN